MKLLVALAISVIVCLVHSAPGYGHGDGHGHGHGNGRGGGNGKGRQDKDKIATLKKHYGDKYERVRERLMKLNKKPIHSKLNPKFLKKWNVTKTVNPQDGDVSITDINAKSGIAEYLYQGDIFLTEEQLNIIAGESSRTKRQISKFANLWPNGIVHYSTNTNLDKRAYEAIRIDLGYISERTCIEFVETTAIPDRIIVENGFGCHSSIGKIIGNVQYLSLDGTDCAWSGTVAHEFMHALGFKHTQARSDRDDYVTLVPENINPNMTFNYDKSNTINDLKYEYGSNMHYSANSFRLDPDDDSMVTMVSKDEAYQFTMGSRLVTFNDIAGINHFYCQGNCTAEQDAKCKNGGLAKPKDCSKCYCPLGYAGDLCDEIPKDGINLNATATWQNRTIVVRTNLTSTAVASVITTVWIQAPEGAKVQMQMVSSRYAVTRFGCFYNGIEPKVLADQQVVNPRYCTPTTPQLESELNPMPVIVYNRYPNPYTVTISYRYVADECNE